MRFVTFVMIVSMVCLAASCVDPTGMSRDDNPEPLLKMYGNDYAGSFSATRMLVRAEGYRVEKDEVLVLLFNEDSTTHCYGGTVTLNNIAIPARFVGGQSTAYQLYSAAFASSTVPIVFDGSWHKFAVSGSSGFPAFADSVQAPTSQVSISSPSVTDTVSKGSGFTVTWSSGTGRSLVTVLDTANHRVSADVGSGNSFSVSSSQLTGFAVGPITVEVSRYRSRADSAGAVSRAMIVGSMERIHLDLKN